MHTTTLFLLLGTLLTPALTFASGNVWVGLDHNSPEYRKCLEEDCADYLGIHSVCDALKSGGNYTVDPIVAEENYLKCVCVEDGFLPALSKCEKCTGESTYSEMKTECDKRTGSNTTPPTNTKTSSLDASSTATTGSPTSTETESQTSATTSAPEETPTETGGGVRSLQLGWWMGAGYSLVVGGVVAFLAGVM